MAAIAVVIVLLVVAGGIWSFLCGWSLFLDFVTAAAVCFAAFTAWRHLRKIQEKTVAEFENTMSREYREICAQLPPGIFDKEEINYYSQDQKCLRLLIRYFDLSNEQLFLCKERGVVDEATVGIWKDGIVSHMKLSAFKQAWKYVLNRYPKNHFEYLEELMRETDNDKSPSAKRD